MPVQVLGHHPQLHDQIAGQVFRLNFTALFPPEPQQRRLILPHDDLGIGTTNVFTPFRRPCGIFHTNESLLCTRAQSMHYNNHME